MNRAIERFCQRIGGYGAFDAEKDFKGCLSAALSDLALGMFLLFLIRAAVAVGRHEQ